MKENYLNLENCPDVINVKEGQQLLRCSRSKLYNLIKRRKIGSIRFPDGAVKLLKKHVVDFIGKHTQEPELTNICQKGGE